MGRPKLYPVTLENTQHDQLTKLVRAGRAKARTITRARILLLSHEGHDDPFINTALHAGLTTIKTIRKRFVQEGLEAALGERPRPGAAPKLNTKQEAVLIALACSDAPGEREHWTMQLLADRLVELKVVDSISDETVRRRLKKTISNPGRSNPGALRN